jgi:hypothetical protein
LFQKKKLQKTEEAIDNSETLEAMEKNHTHRKLKRQETQTPPQIRSEPRCSLRIETQTPPQIRSEPR